ncbi:MAG: DNA primase, partial [Solobacterium sp.]|nr:DNA primase [Solobacterium sp.]
MVRISEEEIQAVRARADIVDVISHYLQVRRQGKNYKAVCPFHDDHDPSMNISPDLQIYKCFVCGAGGNVFSFVQKYEKISYPEAVGRVASLVGYTLSVNPEAYQPKTDPHRENLYKVLNETIRFAAYQLNGRDGVNAKEYLYARGLNDDILTRFEIGYNPGGDSLYRFLHAKGYSDQDLVNVNVARITESGMHDVFSERIMFPIHDAKGNPIGFSARTLRGDTSKYINTNDTELFTKGDIVYNAHRAKTEARRQGKIYVCEGVTDVIAFARAGIENAVCTLGTACTPHQISLLRSLAARIVFCYDGDKAGQAATYRAAKMAVDAGCDVSVIVNKTGLDPDEIIRTQSSEALQQMLRQEVTWIEFVLSYLSGRYNLNSYLEKKQFVEEAKAEISKLSDEADRQYFYDELSRISGMRIENTRQETKNDYRPLKKLSVKNGGEKAEELILCMMMTSAAAARTFEEELGYLNRPEHQTLAMMILDARHTYGSCSPAQLIDMSEDDNIRSLISTLASGEEYGMPYD